MSYAAQRAMAERLLRAKGSALTFERSTPGALNKTTDRPAAPTKITAVARGIVLPLDRKALGADTFENAALLTESHRLVYVAATGMTIAGASAYAPQPGDKLLAVESVDWKVKAVSPLNPDGAGAIVYKVVVVK